MFRIIVGVAALMVAALVACGDSAPEVDLEATVEAQVAARLDAQATSQGVAPTPLPSAVVPTTPLPDGQAPTPLPMATPTITPTPFVGAWEQMEGSARIALQSSTRRFWVEVRCTFNSPVEWENGLEAYIHWGAGSLGPLGSSVRVDVRIDGEDFDEGSGSIRLWNLRSFVDSEQDPSMFAPDVGAFISSMKGANQLVATVWQGGSPITVQWEIAGFRDAVRPIESKCSNFVPTPTPTNTPTPTPPTPTPTPINTPTPTPTPTPLTIRDYLWRYALPVSSSAVVGGIVYASGSDGLYAVDAASGDLRWQYGTELEVWQFSPPAVVDGVVFFSDSPNVYAVDAASGDLRWEYRTEVGIYSTEGVRTSSHEAVGISSLTVVDGVVYFVAYYDADRFDGLYAVDAASGDLQWRYRTEGVKISSLTVVDGIVYASGSDGLYTVDAASGKLRWLYETRRRISSLAVVDGVVYFVSWDGLYAVSAASGNLRWQYPTGQISSLAVVDGVVFVSDSRNVYAVDAASGDQRWQYRMGGRESVSSLAVVDGVVYFLGGEGLQAMDAASGKLLWRYDDDLGGREWNVHGWFGADGVVDGVVYAVVLEGVFDAEVLHVVDAVSGKLRWRYGTVMDDLAFSSLAVADGVVYFGSWDGLYAVDARGR